MGVNIWARTDNGYRLQHDGRGNHYAALRNPPTDWTLQTKTDHVICGPPPQAASGQHGPQKAATLLQHDVGKGRQLGRDSGPETERKEAPHSTHAGRPGTERRNCKLSGKAQGMYHFSTRQWGWRSAALMCNQCRDAAPAQPAHTLECARCGAEKT